MKKLTLILIALLAGAICLQVEAQPLKARRTQLYTTLPDGYEQLDDSKMYYDIDSRWFAGITRLFSSEGPGYRYAVSILGEIDNLYYASTYGDDERDDGCGSGFLAALKVGNNDAVYVNSLDGTSDHGVTMTTRVEAAGEVAARIIYTLTNNNPEAVTINAGVYADIMIGTNDDAPLELLTTSTGADYGIKMKSSTEANAPLLCVLFGEHVTGVVPVDDFWFGFYSSNWHANEIVGNYSSTVYDAAAETGGTYENDASNSQYYMVENGNYDSGLGFCWKARPIQPGESIELSYLISVGEIDFEEPDPDPEPGEDRFTYEVEVYNIGDETIDDPWNDLTVAHPAHIWGYYEHPYGQEGYIEYRVDGARDWTGEWTRIPTALVSGQTYELPFDLFFNPDVTDIHKLDLRFNDGLDNIREMDGLEWEDIRSIDLTVNPETQAYDGTPKYFTVTVGGVIDYTVGENGEYVEPGTYSQSIWGQYEMNTIGINTVEFTVDKGQSVINGNVPDDCTYDGQPHAATVELVQGDGTMTVTYVNNETGETTTDAPVEPGTYTVVVTVTETDHYYGLEETLGTFTIGKMQPVIDIVTPGNVEFDGEAHGVIVTVIAGEAEPTVTYYQVDDDGIAHEIDGEPIMQGVYYAVVTMPETDHYYAA